MHELSIAAAALDAIRAEVALHPGARATRAGLRIGEFAGVEPESLRFCLETLAAGSDLDPLAFDLEVRPWMRRCRECGAEFRVLEAGAACVACGSARTENAGGDEIEFSHLELEEPECGSRSNERS
ncbi:MAG: hydrogenase maturation nickel metallochaperone HypA [Bryobacteraceae bacterium]